MEWLMGKGKKNDKKPVIEEKKPYLDIELCQQRPIFELMKVVRMPCKMDLKEWVATQTISLFHNVNLLYGTVSEFCTAETCPVMQGPCQTQYTWVEERGKKLKCTAPQYIDYVMTFCQKCVSNQELFPTKYAQFFADNFFTEIKKVLKFLYHVIAHMYYAHFARLRQLDLHLYLNVVFKHFILFVREYELLDPKETASLDDLVKLMLNEKQTDAPVEVPTAPVTPRSNAASPGPPVVQAKNNFQHQQLVNASRSNGAASIRFSSIQDCG
uniref:MOB kinase activator 2 n=1 Tax=Phallusia mammillata TaxID=59560 RepID=A0A6F9DL74_9ASCI|nr:MOB kinase activator 2 [Phallusia mammillata]